MDGIPQSELDAFPAMVPPPGETSNFINPPSLFTANLITCYLSIFLALVLFGIRAYTKSFLLKKWYLEDYNCGIAVALFIAFCGLLNWGAFAGGGRHQWNTSISMAMNLIYISTIVETVYCMAMLFAKISLLQQIRHIFAITNKGAVYISTTTLIWMNSLFYIISAFLFTFSCSPREAAWDVLIEGRCINTKVLVVASSAINIVSDLSILIIPVVCTLRLVMPLKRKLGLSVIFATGFFCCGTSIVRLILAYPLLTAEDAVYLLMQIGLLAVAELVTAIMCSCMPCVPRFIKHLRGDDESVSSGSSPHSYPHRFRASESSRHSDDKILAEEAVAYPQRSIDEEAAIPEADWPLPAVAMRIAPSNYFGHDRLPRVMEEEGPTPATTVPNPRYPNQGGLTLAPAANPFKTPNTTINPLAAPFDSRSSSRDISSPLSAPSATLPKTRTIVSVASPANSPPAVEIEDTSPSRRLALAPHISSSGERSDMSPGERAMLALSGRFYRDSGEKGRSLSLSEEQRREAVRGRVEEEWAALAQERAEGKGRGARRWDGRAL